MVNKRTGWFGLVALLLLTACQSPQGGGAPAPSTSGGGPKYGGTAVFANREDPNSWDPLFASGITMHSVADSVQGSGNLVRNCRTDVYKVCPGLAESWEVNADLTEWTFKLRDNVFWHDGQRLTPEDYKWWLEIWFRGFKVGDKVRTPAPIKSYYGELKEVQALDANRVKIVLSRPSPVLLETISEPTATVALPRHLAQARMEAGEVLISPADVGFVGLGPFKFVKHEKGSQVQVKRFDKYWEKDEKGQQLPYLDGIDFPIIPDLNTIIAAFRTGRLDGGARGTGFSLLPQQTEALKRDMGDKVWFAEIAGQRWFLLFNVIRPGAQQDLRVRRAMSLWLDKRAGNQAVMGGQGIITTLTDPRSPWPNPDWKTWPGFNEATRDKDKAEAKRLMAETGLPRVKFANLCRRTWATFCEWLQADLAGLGVDMPLDLKDDASWVGLSRSNSDWDTQILRLDRRFPEAMEAQVTKHSLSAGSRAKHEDNKIPEFFDRLTRARTTEQRVTIYREMERYLLVDQVYAISLFDEVFVFPYRSYVKGLPVPPEDVNQYLDYSTVWLDK